MEYSVQTVEPDYTAVARQIAMNKIAVDQIRRHGKAYVPRQRVSTAKARIDADVRKARQCPNFGKTDTIHRTIYIKEPTQEELAAKAKEVKRARFEAIEQAKTKQIVDAMEKYRVIHIREVENAAEKEPKCLPEWKPRTVRQVIRLAARLTGISYRQIAGAQRSKPTVRVRQAVCGIAYRRCGVPLSRIGKQLGGRDHTTVLYSARKYDAEREARRNA